MHGHVILKLPKTLVKPMISHEKSDASISRAGTVSEVGPVESPTNFTQPPLHNDKHIHQLLLFYGESLRFNVQ